MQDVRPIKQFRGVLKFVSASSAKEVELGWTVRRPEHLQKGSRDDEVAERVVSDDGHFGARFDRLARVALHEVDGSIGVTSLTEPGLWIMARSSHLQGIVSRCLGLLPCLSGLTVAGPPVARLR